MKPMYTVNSVSHYRAAVQDNHLIQVTDVRKSERRFDEMSGEMKASLSGLSDDKLKSVLGLNCIRTDFTHGVKSFGN